MESNYQPQTDIASILQTLRAYGPSQPQSLETTYQSKPFQANSNQSHAPPDLEEGEYDPSTYDPSLPLITTPHPQISHTKAPHPQLQRPPLTPSSTRPFPPTTTTTTPQPLPPTPATLTPPPRKAHPPLPNNPSTITTWPPALRHITSLTTTSPTFTSRIRHLIKTQRTHERQWWTSRLELSSRLANRSEGRKKLDLVLSSLGGNIANKTTNNINNSSATTASSTNKHDEEKQEQELELRLYDRKVHKACLTMAAATVQELKKMEVPFFCVAEGLVVLEDGRAVGEGKGKGAGEGNERAAGTEGGDGNAAGKSKRKGTVSEKELEALRGRMMGLLEDLCGEEVELGE